MRERTKKNPRINLVVAMTSEYIIGYSNRLPWKLSVDLKRFRKLTTSHSVIMGRKTYESIGRPLPKRQNIVVTRRRRYQPKGCVTANSLNAAVGKAPKGAKIFVIGGGELYREAFPISERIYLTLIEIDKNHRQPFLFEPFSGDAHFPRIERSAWRLLRPGVRRLAMPIGTKFADDQSSNKNMPPIYFQFLTLIRRKREIDPSIAGTSKSDSDMSWLTNTRDRTRPEKRSPPTRKIETHLNQQDLFK